MLWDAAMYNVVVILRPDLLNLLLLEPGGSTVFEI